MKNSREIETELAYSWTGNPQTVRSLESLNAWNASSEDYQLIDSLYDTNDELLSGLSTAVRIRSKGTETTMTIKRYVGEGNSGESKFEEISKKLESHQHPEKIERKALNLQLSSSTPAILKQLQFINNRQEILLSHENQKVLLVNEEVTYANKTRKYTEHILEVELINISEGLVRKIRNELESKYPIKIFKEGKSDRAKRFLES